MRICWCDILTDAKEQINVCLPYLDIFMLHKNLLFVCFYLVTGYCESFQEWIAMYVQRFFDPVQYFFFICNSVR